MPSILAVPTKIWGGRLLFIATKSKVGVGGGIGVLVGATVAAGRAVGVGEGISMAAAALVGSGTLVAAGELLTAGASVASGSAVGVAVGSGPHAANKKATITRITDT